MRGSTLRNYPVQNRVERGLLPTCGKAPNVHCTVIQYANLIPKSEMTLSICLRWAGKWTRYSSPMKPRPSITTLQFTYLKELCRKKEKYTNESDTNRHALQQKSHLCFPFLGIAQHQYQFRHICVSERFIYSLDRSTYVFPCSRIGRPILEIYKSVTDIHMSVGTGRQNIIILFCK